MQGILNNIKGLPTFVLGAAFFVFGLNGFLQFMPQPAHEGAAAAFLGGLASAGYFFPFLKGTELLVGLALMTGRYVPLALTVLGPITLNIVLFHVFLEPATLALPLVLLALHLYGAWQSRQVFAPLVRSRVPDPRHATHLGRQATAS